MDFDALAIAEFDGEVRKLLLIVQVFGGLDWSGSHNGWRLFVECVLVVEDLELLDNSAVL